MGLGELEGVSEGEYEGELEGVRLGEFEGIIDETVGEEVTSVGDMEGGEEESVGEELIPNTLLRKIIELP